MALHIRAATVAIVALAFTLMIRPAQAVIRDGGIDPANLGKGDWIYSMTDATNRLGGHVGSVTSETSLMLYYKSAGIRYMIVKAATSGQLFNGCYSGPQFTSNLVNIAHANGILIFGYNRSYGADIAAEIGISDYVFNQGADGFVWDAEAEWETLPPNTWITNGPAQAWQLCSAVRSNWPTKFLAHAPFPIIYFHSSFPYKEFGYWCDAVMPQVYHFSSAGLKGSPSACINWSDVNWATWQNSLLSLPPTNINGLTVHWTNSIKPIIPLQDVYGPVVSGGVICEGTASAQPDEDVLEFIDYSAADPNAQTAGGYKGVNFWRTDLHGAAQWAYIKSGSSGDFPGVVNNIVMDDAKASVVGAWTAVKVFGATTTLPTYYGATGADTNSFGTNYFVKTQGTGSAYVQFSPKVIVDGQYAVYEWHPFRADASASVPFIINYNGGSTTVYASQQTNAGNWSLLGRFFFSAGTNGYVRVMDNFPEAGSVALVDGLKLVFVPPTNSPVAPGGLSAGATGSSQINLVWTDNATNEINYVVARGTASGGPYTNITLLAVNSTNYTDTGLAPDTTYYYVVRATNSVGASTNSVQAAATTLSAAPTITNEPQSQTVTAGQNATFTVTATGTAPLKYQWRFNGSNISGATDSSYTRPNAQTNDAGAYRVVITNALNAVTSAPATLTVNFSLTANAAASGAVSRNPDQTNYAPGSTVTVTAAPNPGYEFFGWSGDASGTNNPLNVTMTTNQSITATFLSTLTDIILDNTNAEVTFDGFWQTGTTAAGRYGSDYRFTLTTGGAFSNATYRPAIGNAGYYDVFVWYPQGGNRATNAAWLVSYQGGSTNVLVNEQTNGGGWQLIAAARPFARGTNGFVRLSNNAGPSVVIADAVRFSFAGPLPPPPPLVFQSITRLTDGRMRLVVSGEAGAGLWIDRASFLPNWLELTNLVNTNGTLEFTDATATNSPQGFYRARQ